MSGHLRPKLLVLVASLSLSAGCAGRRLEDEASPPGAAASHENRPDLWLEWQLLGPVLSAAETHADDAIADQIKAASKLAYAGNFRSAATALEASEQGAGIGQDWLRVARANLAAIHFTTCIRGTHWRLPEGEDELHARKIDMGADAPLKVGDIDVEALLIDLEQVLQVRVAALHNHARIARARVAAFAAQCPATPEVAAMAESVVLADLSQLAAEGLLSPDLAHMWAVVQMQQFSPAAARPFLQMAKEGGFDDPSIDLLLATIALQLGEFQAAETNAQRAEQRFAEYEHVEQQAEALRIQAESYRRREDFKRSKGLFLAALKLDSSSYASIIGLARIQLSLEREADASELLSQRIALITNAAVSLDAGALAGATRALEALLVASGGDASGAGRLREQQADDLQRTPLDRAMRDALLLNIEHEVHAAIRGLRYYYAALLDLRLGDEPSARGHALTAEIELSDLNEPPVDARAFIDHLNRL